jgi:hypothetical protein
MKGRGPTQLPATRADRTHEQPQDGNKLRIIQFESHLIRPRMGRTSAAGPSQEPASRPVPAGASPYSTVLPSWLLALQENRPVAADRASLRSPTGEATQRSLPCAIMLKCINTCRSRRLHCRDSSTLPENCLCHERSGGVQPQNFSQFCEDFVRYQSGLGSVRHKLPSPYPCSTALVINST